MGFSPKAIILIYPKIHMNYFYGTCNGAFLPFHSPWSPFTLALSVSSNVMNVVPFSLHAVISKL